MSAVGIAAAVHAARGPAADTTANATPPSSPSAGSLQHLPVDASGPDPAYYAGFPRADRSGWSDPGFFPVAVFMGKPSHAAALGTIGINTYLGAEDDGTPISAITSAGISVIAQSEWTSTDVGDDDLVVGWLVSDECDMGLGGCASEDGETGSLEIQRRFAAEHREKADGRFLHANFGNGVLGSHWSPTTMDDHLALVDVSSVDKYGYTSPHVQHLLRASPYWPEGREPASAATYGWLQDRMEGFTDPAGSKPNWVFVETAQPFLEEPGATTITVDEISGAVWNALIHGASGIAYFQHNNNGACGTYSLIECSEELRDGVRDVNDEVTSLAPVLNTPTLRWDAGAGADTMLKEHAGTAYLFAMTDGGAGERTLRLPVPLEGTVEVVGEGRTLEVNGGVFTDHFESESIHHVYRFSLD